MAYCQHNKVIHKDTLGWYHSDGSSCDSPEEPREQIPFDEDVDDDLLTSNCIHCGREIYYDDDSWYDYEGDDCCPDGKQLHDPKD